MQEIFLNKNKNAYSVNKPTTLGVSLNGSTRLLPFTEFTENVSMLEEYYKEREESNIFRFILNIKPYCSNVLFNNVTEAIQYQEKDDNGDADLKIISNTPLSIDKGVYGVNDKNWDLYRVTKDTQITNKKCNWDYMCGLNIFNNHLLRRTVFKAVCPIEKKSDDFNTLFDIMRNFKKEEIIDDEGYVGAGVEGKTTLHLYLKEEVLSFKDSIKENLKDVNGWLGFYNSTNIRICDFDDKENKESESLDIAFPLNNKEACEFIHMYPTPDLYSFNPKYNPYKNRNELNWKYCLTYPSRHTTNTTKFNFLKHVDGDGIALKIIYFEEFDSEFIFYSVCEHHLNIGDFVTIYLGEEDYMKNVEVNELGNNDGKFKEYAFRIKSNSSTLCKHKIEFSRKEYNNLADKKRYTFEGKVYPIINKRCYIGNWIDSGLSYRKVVKGVEVDYYVRIFSKIPNWKYAKDYIDFYNVHKDEHLIEEYQKIERDFSSNIVPMAFSKTIYNDDISQIIFDDDIDLSFLRDNLGRPLHEVFLTIIKNNKGYKEWYDHYNGNNTITKKELDDIEYSHAFGKVTSAFKLSPQSLYDETLLNVINLDSEHGIEKPNKKKELEEENTISEEALTNDEDKISITYDNDHTEFYGDLCYYSSYDAVEEHMQYIQYRFNTAQRDIKDFNKIKYDEILSDDFDEEGFKTKTEEYDVKDKKEGYYYQPHYNIKLHSISSELNSQYPYSYNIKKIEKVGDEYKLIVDKRVRVEKGEKVIIYYYNQNEEGDNKYKNANETYMYEATRTENPKIFYIKKIKEELKDIENIDLNSLKVLIPTKGIPEYAKLMKDGSCRFAWRDVVKNGFDSNESDVFPFTNNAYYVTKDFNVYLRRQDPFNFSALFGFGSINNDNDPEGDKLPDIKEDNYVNEEGMIC